MPIEIRELVIKASIAESPSLQESEQTPEAADIDREEIVADCVEQVMELLKHRGER